MSDDAIYGIHAVARFIERSPQDAVELICQEHSNPRLRQLIAQAQVANIEISHAARDELARLAGSDKHQGCVLKIRRRSQPASLQAMLQAIHSDSLFLVLDGVQDPHNLGACLRTADAAGVDAVIIPKQRAARVTASVRKVAAGAAESVPVIEVTNVSRCLDQLKQAGVWIYGTCGDAGESLYDHRFDAAVALVMGGEGDGLRRLTREHCDHLINLPMRGQVESLNVSVATGICLYEIRRARSACGGS